MVPRETATRRRRQTLGMVLALASNAVATTAHASALSVRLEPGAAPGEIVFELSNTGERSVSVLRWDTPLEAELSADVFAIGRTLKTLPLLERPRYAGRVFKRGPPRREDFAKLAPGVSLRAVVDLGRYYDVPEAADYSVRYSGALLLAPPASVTGVGRRARPQARAHRVHDLIEVRPATRALRLTLAPGGGPSPRARPPTFNACDAEQRDAIVAATAAAETITAGALESLRDLPLAQRPTALRYATWFGAYDAVRYERVADGFEAVLGSLAGATLNYDCSCTDNAFAYVYPLQLHDIYLCPLFFRAELLGTDSRAGTIVHELSHFNELVGTDDHAYGQSAAAALAERDPPTATDNADNFEYFAENNPPLPMSSGGGQSPVPAPPDPTPGSGTVDFTRLRLDDAVSGTVAEGRSDLYVVDGADTVELLSRDGDADLYVFDDPALAEAALVCSSSTTADVDRCPLTATTTHYVAVFGFSAADYEVFATMSSAPPPTPRSPTPLVAGASDEGALAEGDFVVYAVTAPARIELSSLDGDADLAVFASESLTADDLICESERTAALDLCAVDVSGTVYAVVYGFNDSRYRVSVAAEPGAAGPPLDDPFAGGGDGGGGGALGWLCPLVGIALLGLRRRPRRDGFGTPRAPAR